MTCHKISRNATHCEEKIKDTHNLNWICKTFSPCVKDGSKSKHIQMVLKTKYLLKKIYPNLQPLKTIRTSNITNRSRLVLRKRNLIIYKKYTQVLGRKIEENIYGIEVCKQNLINFITNEFALNHEIH